MIDILRRNIWMCLVVVLLAGGFTYAFWPQPVPVDMAIIERGEMLVTIDGDGQTRVREVYVVSAPISGRVLRTERHAGDEVKAGETLLATIRPADPTFLDRRARTQAESAVKAAEAGFALARAERARVQAELDFARAELGRARKLSARGNLSQRNLDRAVLNERTATAALAQSKAGLSMRSYELETARAALIQPGADGARAKDTACCVNVYAPVDGKVLRVLHESEAVVAAGTPLLELGDPADLEVVVDLLSGDAVRVTRGAPVTIEDWGGGKVLVGHVRRIEPSGFTKVSALGIEEQRVNVIVDFTEAREKWLKLGHGYRVEVRIEEWRGADLLKLPLGALFRDGDDWAVFAVVDERAVLRRISIGHRNGREAEVLDGLGAGDAVVLHPGDRIAEGVRVTARRED